MDHAELSVVYRGYLACLNRQDWPQLDRFVRDDVIHNGLPIGRSGYRAMLERDFAAIPDLSFDAELLICREPYVAARLCFDCTPKADFLDLAVNGRRIRFAEHVIYAFSDGRIAQVWSIIDKRDIEAQIEHAKPPR